VNIEIIQHGLLGICFLMLGMSLLFPYLGLLGYIIIYFLRVGEVYPALGSIRFELLAGVYVLIRMFIAGTPSAARLWSNPTTKALAAFIMVVFLSVPFAVSPDVSWEWAIYYLKRFIFAFMVLAAVDTREKLKGFFWTFSLMTCWVALEPFLGYLGGQAFVAQDVFRIRGSTGYFDNPNALANTTSQALPLLWGLLLSTRSKITKAFLFALGVFCLVLIVMTGSRGGGLGVAVLGGVLVWQSKNRARAGVLGFCAFLFILAIMGPRYRARHGTTLQLGQSDGSAHSRIMGLQHGFSMLVRRPILGVGIGCYPEARSRWFGWGLWAHNHYGQLMGELGLIGTAVWTWLIISIFRNLSNAKILCSGAGGRSPPDMLAYANAVQALFIMRLVVGMTVHSLYGEVWYVFAAVAVQLALITQVEQEQAEDTFFEESEDCREGEKAALSGGSLFASGPANER